MRYARVIAEALREPWAVLDAKFDAIVSVLARREADERFTEDQIRAVVGERKISANASSYVIDEEGRVFKPHVDFETGLTTMSAFEAAAQGGAKGKLTAVIPIYGLLMPRATDFDMSEYGTSIEQLRKSVRMAVANPDVKAIVFDVDSPGGSVYQIDELAQEIFDARSQKKIVAQVNSLAASAAYYLASQASEIAITPTGEAGSIGVRAMHQDLSKALEQKGIKVTNITYGKYKVEGNPFEPLSEEGLAFMQQRVNDYGEMFVKAVARGRDVKVAQVKDEFGEGRVFGASEAKRRGMVDRIATLDETLARLGASADSSRVAMHASADVATTASAEMKKEANMATPAVNPTAAAAADLRKDESERIAQITRLATEHKCLDKAAAWIVNGKSVADCQAEILASLKPEPIQTPAPEPARVQVVRDETEKVLANGIAFGRCLRAMAGAKKFSTTPKQFANAYMKDPITAGFFAAADPQAASTVADGGFMIPDPVLGPVIELLRPKSVVRSLNPTLAPLVNGSLNLPKVTSGAIGYYIGENKPAKPSKVKGGNVKASAKKLAVLVPISNDLLRYGGANADMIIRDDAVRAIAQKEDVSFIRSAGTEYSPRGLRYWAANVIAAQASPDLAKVRTDVGKLRLALLGKDVAMARPGWIMSPRTEEYLLNLADAAGNLVYYNEMVNSGTFRRYPYRVTTQIPENLGTGTNESELYLADFADVVIADAPAIAVETSTEAAYDDGSGTITSAFSNDQTVLRMLVEHDLIVRHEESVAVLTTVLWI